MSYELTEKLIDEIIVKRKQRLANKIQRYPVTNFRASDIHECDRYMVYSVLNWQDKALHDESLQALFDAGNREENSVKIRLQEDGFNIIHQQMPFEIKNRNGEVICRGHIDGKVLYEGVGIPWEIKSMDANIFRTITSLDDFQKKPHLRKYLRQMQLYLFGNNEEAGFFTISDFRHEKHLPVILDLGECEFILQRLERNWECVKKKEYPKPIDYSKQICGRCPYGHLCLQPIENKGAKFIDNIELEEKLDRREKLEEIVEEYESIDKEVKDTFNEIPEAFVGKSWQIVGEEKERKGIDTKAMPDNIKKQYEKITKFWQTKIIKIG